MSVVPPSGQRLPLDRIDPGHDQLRQPSLGHRRHRRRRQVPDPSLISGAISQILLSSKRPSSAVLSWTRAWTALSTGSVTVTWKVNGWNLFDPCFLLTFYFWRRRDFEGESDRLIDLSNFIRNRLVDQSLWLDVVLYDTIVVFVCV